MIRQRRAIYTRKSTEEGLEQDFNSLDAQREACAAYILSQKHEGWLELADRYDDGGFSGGSMDRPGLTQLLEDVRGGRVDVIVVYKVDRLTRSLADFAKMVDVFDGAGMSFVFPSATEQLAPVRVHKRSRGFFFNRLLPCSRQVLDRRSSGMKRANHSTRLQTMKR